MAAYVGSALTIVVGTIAGALKLSEFVTRALWKGKNPPAFSPEGVELGAAVLHHLTPNCDDFEDVTIVSKGGVKLHAVQDNGKHQISGKRPIVFVHGFPEIWVSWAEQLQHFLLAGHPVLALSMRGYGKSDKPTGLESFHLYDCLAEDVRAAVSHAAARGGSDMQPLLVGHDWGSAVCWAYVGQKQTIASGDVAGYISLANAPAEAFVANMGLRQLWASLYMAFFNMPWLPERLFLANNAWLVGLLMNDCSRDAPLPPWLLNTYRANCLQPGAMRAQLDYYRSAIQLQPKADNILGKNGNRLKLPVLMIRGQDDVALLGSLFHNYDRFLASGRLVEFEKCSHWIQADCPNELNTEIETFLKKLE